jgi:hypothetical protein
MGYWIDVIDTRLPPEFSKIYEVLIGALTLSDVRVCPAWSCEFASATLDGWNSADLVVYLPNTLKGIRIGRWYFGLGRAAWLYLRFVIPAYAIQDMC